MNRRMYDCTRKLACMRALSPAQQDHVIERADGLYGLDAQQGCRGVAVIFGTLIVMAGGAAAMALGEERNTEVLGFVVAALSLLCVVLVRERAKQLRRVVAWQCARTSCPSCGESLVGAFRSAEGVRCSGSEGCGHVYSYKELKIEMPDVGPPMLALGPDAQCPGCRYSWDGLRAHLGQAVCPECGRREAVLDVGLPPAGESARLERDPRRSCDLGDPAGRGQPGRPGPPADSGDGDGHMPHDA